MNACAKCGAAVPPEAQFCMSCGTPAPGAQILAQPGVVAAAAVKASNRNLLWIIVLTSLLGVLAVLFALDSMGLLRVRGHANEPGALQVQGLGMSPPLLRAKAEKSEPVLTEKGPKRMPDDIRAWLEHLERIEKRRVDLTNDQLSQAIRAYTMAQVGGAVDMLKSMAGANEDAEPQQPHQEFAADVEAMKPPWTQLTNDLTSVMPPADCQNLARDYERVLRETKAMMFDVLSVLAQPIESKEDQIAAIGKLTKMKGTSTSQIDEVGASCDRQLGEICDRYDTRKWFKIASDIGGNDGMFSKLGSF